MLLIWICYNFVLSKRIFVKNDILQECKKEDNFYFEIILNCKIATKLKQIALLLPQDI